MRTILLVLLLALVSRPVEAQALHLRIDEPAWQLATAEERRLADYASWASVSAAILLDTIESARADRPKQAFLNEGMRLFVTYFAAQAMKVTVHRRRPCSPDCGRDRANESFYSMHTAFAFQAIGDRRFAVSIPLAASTGGLRVAAGKHWISDVIAGAGMGLLTSRIR